MLLLVLLYMKYLITILIKTWLLTLIIIIWQLMLSFGIWSEALVASPQSTLLDYKYLIQNGELKIHIFASLSRIFVGFVCGSIFGIIFGLIIGTLKKIKINFDITISIFYSIPPIAWIPFYIITFGVGETTKILLIAFTFFTVVSVHTWEGVLQTEKNFLHLSHLFEKNYFQKIVHIWLPCSAAHILNGIKIATFYAWGVLITSEIIASSSGLGYFLWNSRQFSRSDDMMVAITTIGLLGLLSDLIINFSQKKLLKWQNKTV